MIELGCGDGNQLVLADYAAYTGFDVSCTAIDSCKTKFLNDTSKTFKLMAEYQGETADLSLSLDVIYHLAEDEIFENYMRTLFSSANNYEIIYASDSDDNEDMKLVEHIANKYPYRGGYKKGSFADFYIYKIG